jgi:hypothetical protein
MPVHLKIFSSKSEGRQLGAKEKFYWNFFLGPEERHLTSLDVISRNYFPILKEII